MAKMDYKAAVATVKAAHDIVDYMRAAGIDLKPNGVGKWKGLCFNHKEKTPSLTVSDVFQNYKCFGCGVSGDIFAFAMSYENFSFPDALKKLAEAKNIELDVTPGEGSVDFTSLQNIMKVAANFYCKKFDALPEDHVAKQEVSKRGLTFDNRRKEWLRYGYSPAGNALTKYLKAQGYTEDLMVQAGLCRKNKDTGEVFDFYRSRLMFVFTDRYGKPIGFSSRKLFEDDQRGKYVNHGETPLFHKSRVLYNHVLARKASGPAKEVFICEGQFDVAAFLEAGLPQTVAASGTALTRDHVVECQKMVGPGGRLTFCFDGDEAGLATAAKVFLNFPEVHEEAHVVVFPPGKDPCDLYMEGGASALKDLVKKPLPLVEFMIVHTKASYDLDSLVGRSKYVGEAVRYIKSVPNLLLRDAAVRLLSAESLTPLDEVRAALEEAQAFTFDHWQEGRQDAPQQEEGEGEEAAPETAALLELLAQEPHHNLAARFLSLGMGRPKWRSSVVRSKNLLPKTLHGFVDELAAHAETSTLFPELFQDQEVAAYLMGHDFATFYRFMDGEELREHFIYLHGLLQKHDAQMRARRKQEEVLRLLQQDGEGSLEYFRALMKGAGLQEGNDIES